ncbi:hypothetical protein Q5N06_27440, partial [Klebsiella pneumoniae]|nr:hypothetical protein [Klebsiella pneumoniae]
TQPATGETYPKSDLFNKAKKWLQGMEWFAIQGHYWKEVSIEQLVKEDIKV